MPLVETKEIKESTVEQLKELEKAALKMVLESNITGVLQSDLWKRLGASSREASRIVTRLEGLNIISKKKELYKGRWTYRLFYQNVFEKISEKNPEEKSSIEILEKQVVTCFRCDDLELCGVGHEISPVYCRKLTDYLLL
ncbi:MAG: Lrp/AsnC family transcriptional regulator [Candidatus Wukongarchaeota archaeon]|nr:Lrp/AsnC family transcriptional regulator [Candidatus Wukongarchaeota archaeon]